MKLRKFLLFVLSFNLLSCSDRVQKSPDLDVTFSPQREFAQQFSSAQLEWVGEDQSLKLEAGAYPAWTRYLMNSFFAWKPLGQKSKYSKECEPALWARRLQDPRLEALPLQGALLQKYFQTCDQELETGVTSKWQNVFKLLTIDYNYHQHPFLNRVQFNLPNGIKLQGLLALKGDLKPRPLIVMRMGIFTNVDESMAEKFLMINWFEQGPFNVLFLDNISGALFLNHNPKKSFGGFDEAIQNIQIAKLVRDEAQPISKIVSSVHFAGLSLGGNGVLYSSLLNETNSYKGLRLINSFLGFCPVVYLQDSMERLVAPNFSNKFVDVWSRRRLAATGDWLKIEGGLFDYLPRVIQQVNQEYAGALTWDGQVALPVGIQNSSNFWKVNDFIPYYHDVQSPFLTFVTDQDELVPYALNSARVKADNFKMIKLNQGYHCTLPIAYNWDVWPSLLNAYFKSHSPDLKMQNHEIPVPVIFNKSQQEISFRVRFPEDKRFVEVNLTGPFEATQVNLPLSGFDFYFHNQALSQAEKDMLERWLNQNLEFKVRGDDVVLTWETVE